MLYTVLAVLVLILHFLIVLFIVGGFVLIWLGYFRQWRFVRNRTFRLVHLGAMAVVLLESVTGIVCPLTLWEAKLRSFAEGEGDVSIKAVESFVGRLIYYDIDPQLFMILYGAFFLVLLFTFVWVRP